MSNTISSTNDRRTSGDLDERLLRILAHVLILPRRMRLETPGVEATVPMLRGVWGAALHGLDSAVYRRVFDPNNRHVATDDPRSVPNKLSGPLARRGSPVQPTKLPVSPARSAAPSADAPRGHGTWVPSYILRPAPPDPRFAPAVEWLLLGAAVKDNITLCRAWDIASGMGLARQRHRFHVRETLVLLPDGSTIPSAAEWTLDRAALLIANGRHQPPDFPVSATPEPEPVRGWEAADRPCQIVFRAPLRVIVRGQLAPQPTWSDLVAAACRRVGAFLPSAMRESWQALQREVLEASRHCRTSAFQGSRLDLHRYSARQKAELDLQGVQGSIALHDGPGALWPLLAAAQWLHFGKGTVMGLGQPEIHPL